jgi:hypothetical protein
MLDFKFWILNEEENEESVFFFDPRSMICDLLSYLFHSRFFASIRGSKTLNESALRGRIALPDGEMEQDAPWTAWIKMIQLR